MKTVLRKGSCGGFYKQTLPGPEEERIMPEWWSWASFFWGFGTATLIAVALVIGALWVFNNLAYH